MNFFQFLFLGISDFELFGDVCVTQCGDALKLNIDFLQTLKLLREQDFLKLLLHLRVAFLSLLSHLCEKLGSFFFAHVAEVCIWPLRTALLLHFGECLFLIGRDLQLGANGFDSKQTHGHVATTAATKHASTSAAAATKTASASSAATTLSALTTSLGHRGSNHKCQ